MEEKWYGWQTLVSDGASFLLIFAANNTESNRAFSTFQFGLGAAGFFLAPPILHWAHGHTGRGFVSLGMRLGAPLVGALLLTNSLESSQKNVAVAASGMMGFVILAAWIPTSIAVDASIAYDKVPKQISFSPIVTPVRGGGVLGVGGMF